MHHHHHCKCPRKLDNDPDHMYLAKLKASVLCMLDKHYPCSDPQGKEYSCLVSPENIWRLLQHVRHIKCERDWIASQASRLAARMEGIGLGHMDDNPCDWLRAAHEHCLLMHPRKEPPSPPKPPKPECPEPAEGYDGVLTLNKR